MRFAPFLYQGECKMKKIKSSSYFICYYSGISGILFICLSLILPSNSDALLFFGIVLLISAFIMMIRNFIIAAKEQRIRKLGICYPAKVIKVMDTKPNAVHLRGLISFVVMCVYDDPQGTSYTAYSNNLVVTKWNKAVLKVNTIEEFRECISAVVYADRNSKKTVVDVYYNI